MLLAEEAGRAEPAQYVLAPPPEEIALDSGYAARVQDVLIAGEVGTSGHLPWRGADTFVTGRVILHGANSIL